MRLTCPRCGAQYEIPDSAIPATGREVECSACSEVWHQAATEEPVSPAESEPVGPAPVEYDPSERPSLNRPLHESILSILREETARELSARKPPREAGSHAADTDPDHIDATAPDGPGDDAITRLPKPQDIAWPVATVILPGEPLQSPPVTQPDADKKPAEPVGEIPASSPAPAEPPLPDAARLAATLLRHSPSPAVVDEDQDRPTETPLVPAPPVPDAPPPAPAAERSSVALVSPPAVVPVVQGRQSRGGYAMGFGLAVMLALALLAFYALAPRFSTEGDGSFIAESRAGLDRGRLWLSDRTADIWAGLTGR